MAGDGGGGGDPTPTQEISYLRKEGKEAHTYLYSSAVFVNELPFMTGMGGGLGLTVIDCTALNDSSTKTKNIRFLCADTNQQSPPNFLFDVWFGDTAKEVVDAANSGPASFQLPAVGGYIDIQIPVTTKYFGIDYSTGTGSSPDAITTLFAIIIS